MFDIRKATPADIALIRELTFQVWPQTYAAIISKEQIDYMLGMMYSPASLEKQMNDGCQFILVYEQETPVGFASYQHQGNGAWKLHKIYILGSQQGKGTGKFVIDHICEAVRSQGGKTIELQVNINNKAKTFYDKIGFTIADHIKLDIGNGYIMDDYIMKKELS